MSLSKINTWLLILIIIFNGYVLAAPFIPVLVFAVQKHAGKEQQLTRLVQQAKQATPAGAASTPAPEPNHVVIPSMQLNEPIYEGPQSQQYKILDKGIWRLSWGSTPDKGGNTVLIGHRFTYTNPRGVFYYLNKVSLGDELGVWWNGREYTYKVSSITEVEPTDTSIENRSSQAEITIFTCTPLWLPKHRLVVVAQLEGNL